MQITLDSSEIKQAIVSFVRDQGIDLTNTDVEVGMTAGRGVNGTTATVDIIPKSRATGSTGVKSTFHNVTNLEPRTTKAEVEEKYEEEPEEETTDPVLTDPVEEEEPEEEEVEDAPVAMTNSIFK
jgi:hypothetical protein